MTLEWLWGGFGVAEGLGVEGGGLIIRFSRGSRSSSRWFVAMESDQSPKDGRAQLKFDGWWP